MAAIHGCKIREDNPKNTQGQTETNNQFMFGDPAKYEKMSQEERDKLTEKMMSKYKKWANEESTLKPRS